MNEAFLKELYEKHQKIEQFPATSSICKLITKVILTLYPEQARKQFKSVDRLSEVFNNHRKELVQIMSEMEEYLPGDKEGLAKAYFDKIPAIFETLNKDIEAILAGDPAARTEYEVVRAYPGFYAIAFYRLAHGLYELNVPLLPRVLTEYAHSRTGIDIHPGANISPYFCIDHGTGIVIGETTEIGKYVKIYQGVTLGALSVSKKMATTKRHPTIEDNVVIYSGATILGGETTIGHDSIIGGNVWITESLPPFSKVYHRPQIEVSKK